VPPVVRPAARTEASRYILYTEEKQTTNRNKEQTLSMCHACPVTCTSHLREASSIVGRVLFVLRRSVEYLRLKSTFAFRDSGLCIPSSSQLCSRAKASRLSSKTPLWWQPALSAITRQRDDADRPSDCLFRLISLPRCFMKDKVVCPSHIWESRPGIQ
jgi:hypothetical protein